MILMVFIGVSYNQSLKAKANSSLNEAISLVVGEGSKNWFI